MEQRRVERAVIALWCRELGMLLRLGVPELGALEVVAREIEPLAAVSVGLEASVQAGESLARAIANLDEVFPPLVRAAVLAGETTGRLDEALIGAAECLREQAALNVASTPRSRLAELAEQATPAPAVVLSRRIMARAVEMGARRVRLSGGAGGGVAEAEVNGQWQRLEDADAEVFAALCRRIKLMADIPYWITEPAVGTMRLSLAEHGVWDVAVQAIPDDDGVGQRIELTLLTREGA